VGLVVEARAGLAIAASPLSSCLLDDALALRPLQRTVPSRRLAAPLGALKPPPAGAGGSSQGWFCWSLAA